MNRTFLLLVLLLQQAFCFSQAKWATVSGRVVNENEETVAGASVTLLGTARGTTTSDSGFFEIRTPADGAFALVFSYTGYRTAQHNFSISPAEKEQVTIRLEKSSALLQEVVVQDNRQRTEAGLIRLNPKSILNLPTPVTSVESLIKVFVGSNNELTSQYTVRGGSFDENLIYVNDFEIFRPYLVRSGQQEGLSFINPALVRNISFYSGGFPARYGDKLSSVLDIQYSQPTETSGSAYVGLLEQGVHLQGTKDKFTYLIGARNRSNQNLLRSQPTTGVYTPSASDVQGLFTFRANAHWSSEMLANISASRFQFLPQAALLTAAEVTPFGPRVINATVALGGHEQDVYRTQMLGFSATYQPYKKLRLKFLASRFQNSEAQNIDVGGSYQFGEMETGGGSPEFGAITLPLGAGAYQTYARDALTIVNYNLSHRGSLEHNGQLLLWGLSLDRTGIDDASREWELRDSAGYTQPVWQNRPALENSINTSNHLVVFKWSGFAQNNFAFAKAKSLYTLQTGMRFNYNSLNGEFLLSPRINASWKPNWNRDIIFKLALGAYNQPPFYREMRRYDGTLNTHLKAQRSVQLVAGADYNFKSASRTLRFTSEAYYKKLSHVVPYDIDNVRLRYFGENSARAYAAGIEARLYGDVVKDAESWISVGLMRTRENLDDDAYYKYTIDSAGMPADSTLVHPGWLRRPTDRLVTFGMFFQDYLSTNKNFKVFLNTLYGSNLPYNVPGSVRNRNALRIPAYLRVDLGFSALLLDTERANRRSHNPFRNFENIWASLEVFNLIDRENTISYMLLKDYTNNTYALPNRLTPRLLNFKLIARW